MRFLLLLSCLCLGLVAQQPPKGCEQPAKNEEDSCCCTTYDANMCLDKVEKKVDAELNDVYQSALKRWDEDPQNSELRDAQRAWIAYRDATCKAEANIYKGGTILPSVAMRCDLRVTRRRIADLKDAYLFNR